MEIYYRITDTKQYDLQGGSLSVESWSTISIVQGLNSDNKYDLSVSVNGTKLARVTNQYSDRMENLQLTDVDLKTGISSPAAARLRYLVVNPTSHEMLQKSSVARFQSGNRF